MVAGRLERAAVAGQVFLREVGLVSREFDPRKWVQVVVAVVHEIETGLLDEGDVLTIGTLAQKHKVTRQTVSKALQLLAEHSIVHREHNGYAVLTSSAPDIVDLLSIDDAEAQPTLGELRSITQGISYQVEELSLSMAEQTSAVELVNRRAIHIGKQVDPDGTLPPEERRQRAEQARLHAPTRETIGGRT